MLPDLSHLGINARNSAPDSSNNSEEVSLLPRVPVEKIEELLPKPSMVEFTVENPGIDNRVKSLWNQPYTTQWLDRWGDLVNVVPTTYCQYAQYPESKQPHKPTSIMTTLPTLPLQQPCSAKRPCPELCDPRSDGHHSVQVSQRDGAQSSLSECEKNAIPERLIHNIIASWVGSKWEDGYRNFLVVDVFAGWGSVKNAVATFANSSEATHMVDTIQGRDYNDNNDSSDLALRRILAVLNPESLVQYVGFDAIDQRIKFRDPTRTEMRHDSAHGRKRKRIGVHTNTKYIGDYLDTPHPILNIIGAELATMNSIGVDRVAVWVHASPPCTTFSLAGLATHRPSNGPASDLANEHDQLVKQLLEELALLAQLHRR